MCTGRICQSKRLRACGYKDPKGGTPRKRHDERDDGSDELEKRQATGRCLECGDPKKTRDDYCYRYWELKDNLEKTFTDIYSWNQVIWKELHEREYVPSEEHFGHPKDFNRWEREMRDKPYTLSEMQTKIVKDGVWYHKYRESLPRIQYSGLCDGVDEDFKFCGVTPATANPTTVRSTYWVCVCGPKTMHCQKVWGKWLIFTTFEKLDATWHMVRRVVESGELGAMGAKASTAKKPLNPGKGVICVYTSMERVKEVGVKLVHMVKQAILYKLQEATIKGERSSIQTYFWSGGKPYSYKSIWSDGKKVYFKKKPR